MKKTVSVGIAVSLAALWGGYAAVEEAAVGAPLRDGPADGTESRSAPGTDGAARLPAPEAGTAETDLRGGHKGDSVVGWANQAHWDSVGFQVFYFGLGHYASPKFLSYSAVSNEWTVMPLPEWADKRKRTGKIRPVGHMYDDLAVWPEKRLYAVAGWDPIQV